STLQQHHGSADSLPDLPEPEGAVLGAREGIATIGGHRYRLHGSLVAGKSTDGLAGHEIPEPERAIGGGRKGVPTVWSQCHCAHLIVVTGKHPEGLAGGQVPELEGAVA